MRKFAQLALVFLVLAGRASAQEFTWDELWRTVAQSHLIVIGTPTVPIQQLEEAQRTGKHLYVDVPVDVRNCLKAVTCTDKISIRFFSDDRSYAPSARSLIGLSGKESVLFLLQVDAKYTEGMYFAGYTPKALQAYSAELVQEVGNEVAAQSEIVAHIEKKFPAESQPEFRKVRFLIGAMNYRLSETWAFTRLEKMGTGAVPATIMLMDDRRELPLKAISLENKGPERFEDFRHYGPEVLADALAAILEQVTGESFGTIHNGGSERERRVTVDAWRVYLYRTRIDRDDRDGQFASSYIPNGSLRNEE